VIIRPFAGRKREGERIVCEKALEEVGAGEGRNEGADSHVGESCPNVAALTEREHHPRRNSRIVVSSKQAFVGGRNSASHTTASRFSADHGTVRNGRDFKHLAHGTAGIEHIVFRERRVDKKH
jgi:hypothetical protein